MHIVTHKEVVVHCQWFFLSLSDIFQQGYILFSGNIIARVKNTGNNPVKTSQS